MRRWGLLAVWPAYDDDAFVERLDAAGSAADDMKMRPNGGRAGPRHTIWFASRLEVQ
ncbi:hypothetical protein FHS96_004504 [Sphingomonas zeicaulis]|uniref:hypothetical protein n=1 Tax=Sphingomonas zeicaulis TaxID=1632740 RepID=UPI003D235EF6